MLYLDLFNKTLNQTDFRNLNETKGCEGQLSALNAFLYGFPGGFILAGLILFCFIMFGQAITGTKKHAAPSVSSNTQADKKDALGKKRNRGPPPSSALRPVDMTQLAMSEDAPDDIKAMLSQAGKLSLNTKNTKQVVATRGLTEPQKKSKTSTS